jgi:hypothetical protein
MTQAATTNSGALFEYICNIFPMQRNLCEALDDSISLHRVRLAAALHARSDPRLPCGAVGLLVWPLGQQSRTA